MEGNIDGQQVDANNFLHVIMVIHRSTFSIGIWLFMLETNVHYLLFVYYYYVLSFLTVCLCFTVKPDPPESVLVNEIAGYPKRLNVSWDFPSSWPTENAFPLIFHIRYKPQGSVYWSEVSHQYVLVIGENTTLLPHI